MNGRWGKNEREKIRFRGKYEKGERKNYIENGKKALIFFWIITPKKSQGLLEVGEWNSCNNSFLEVSGTTDRAKYSPAVSCCPGLNVSQSLKLIYFFAAFYAKLN